MTPCECCERDDIHVEMCVDETGDWAVYLCDQCVEMLQTPFIGSRCSDSAPAREVAS